MIPEIKAKWVKALRSRKYRQTDGFLKYEGGFCCLGVLCDVQGIDWESVRDDELNCGWVPNGFAAGLSDGDQMELAEMNDEGRSFGQIAKHIEQNL